jgi:ABC-2 type transport system permease protein
MTCTCGTNYAPFVTPGIVIMMALFGGGWNGMVIIMEIDQGVMDRFLVSPVSRFAIIAGRLCKWRSSSPSSR